jgi:arsenical pump membrane protein
VLVAGLLLIGLVADGDGLFRFAGQRLGRAARSGTVLFIGAAAIVTVVTVTLNLDTAVAFLTPVLVYTARSRDDGAEPAAAGPVAGAALLYGCLMLANAGSLLLPGSNLTNLIVLGHLHLTGGQFVARMWLAWLAAVLATAAVVGVGERRSLRAGTRPAADGAAGDRPVLGVGLAAVVLATGLVVGLRSPAIAVAVVGLVAVGIRLAQRRVTVASARQVLACRC